MLLSPYALKLLSLPSLAARTSCDLAGVVSAIHMHIHGLTAYIWRSQKPASSSELVPMGGYLSMKGLSSTLQA